MAITGQVAVTECDVLVIGGGPGGGAAALHCARAGLATRVVEEHGEIGVPVHCGECISALAVDQLHLNLPESVISRPVKGIRVIFPDGTARKLTEPGYVLEKHEFERWISREAEKAGAVLHLSHRLYSLEKLHDGGRFVGWRCSGDGDMFPIRAGVVIDASGVAGVASRLLKLNPRPQVIAGLQYEMQDVPTDGYLDFYIWPSYATRGYVWVIPKAGGRANVGLVSETRKGVAQGLERFISQGSLKGRGRSNPPWRGSSEPAKGFGGAIPISGPVDRTVDDGLLLVGDAAGFTSPLFEGGSHLALKSAGLAAQAAIEALGRGDTGAESLRQYEERWRAEFPPYDRIMRGKDALYALSDEEISLMGRCLPEEMSYMGVQGKARVGLRLLRRRPSLLRRRVIPAMMAFGYSRAKHCGW